MDNMALSVAVGFTFVAVAKLISAWRETDDKEQTKALLISFLFGVIAVFGWSQV